MICEEKALTDYLFVASEWPDARPVELEFIRTQHLYNTSFSDENVVNVQQYITSADNYPLNRQIVSNIFRFADLVVHLLKTKQNSLIIGKLIEFQLFIALTLNDALSAQPSELIQ